MSAAAIFRPRGWTPDVLRELAKLGPQAAALREPSLASGTIARQLWDRRLMIEGAVFCLVRGECFASDVISNAERFLRVHCGFRGPIPATLGFVPPDRGFPPWLIGALGEPDETGEIDPNKIEAVCLVELQADGSRADEAPLFIGANGKAVVIGRELASCIKERHPDLATMWKLKGEVR